MNVAHEVELLVGEIKRLGTPNADGQYVVKFGVLFADDKCANLFVSCLPMTLNPR